MDFNEYSVEELTTALSTAVSQIGISFEEATRNIVDLTTALNDLQNRICVCENEIFDCARSELDALTEKPNQKEDLEIFEQKGTRRLLPIIEDRIIPIDTKDLDEWYENFLKELGYE